ncbi:hypothetical protein L6164_017977 [Bauhinia variegata]|uniref:Uncharacterized protein n=1 Tax=Bauhinia variegata TaxID=167791 RepID=A0ACB9NAD3_BAUVA|nr:hypothetical protein L6164_017977 [Bauhinia variegata]
MAALAISITEEPILSRIDRLDKMLRQLEEIRGYNKSPKSSCESTPSSGTLTSDGHVSSLDFSPKSLQKHCRPIENVIVETEMKGTLIERLNHVENRMFKLEEEWEAEKKNGEGKTEEKTSQKKKGLKQLVKQCVKGTGKQKTRTHDH